MLVHRVGKEYFMANEIAFILLCDSKLNDDTELTSFNDNVTCEKCLEEIKKGFKFDGIYETAFLDSIKAIEELI